MTEQKPTSRTSDDYGREALTDHTANAIYDVLVAEVGAAESDRGAFVHHQTKHEECVEWRFCGSLGFGGKFWRNGLWYVNCYSEDRTPERDKAMGKANALLAALYEKGSLCQAHPTEGQT